jgi:hypothetical protein
MISNFDNADRTVTATIDAAALFGQDVAGVQIEDVDVSLPEPEKRMLEKSDAVAPAADILEDDGDLAALGDSLEENDPRAEEAERLKAMIDGHTVTVVIRDHDYRVFRVTAAVE